MSSRVELIDQQALFSFLKRALPLFSFDVLVHILTEPYISLLESMPADVKETSRVFLDGEKRAVNDYAVSRLRRAGFRNVFYVNGLHAKLITVGRPPAYRYVVLGSSNLTQRSFDNYEIILLIERPGARLSEGIARFVADVASRGYTP